MIFLFFGDKMKKIFIYCLTLLGLFVIYKQFDNHKVNYVSIGDGITKGISSKEMESYGYNNFIYEYLEKKHWIGTFNNSFSNNTISALLKDVKNNRTLRIEKNEFYLKKVLRESDFLVISVGQDELSNNYDKYDMSKNKALFNKMYNDIEELIKEIRKYAKGKIIFLGYYNPTNYYDSKVDEFFYHIDTILNKLLLNYQVAYLDLYETIKSGNYKENDNTYNLNIHGFRKVANLIEFYLE